MSGGDVEILRRAHALFDLATTHPLLEDPGAGRLPSAAAAGAMAAAYRGAASTWLDDLRRAREVDATTATPGATRGRCWRQRAPMLRRTPTTRSQRGNCCDAD